MFKLAFSTLALLFFTCIAQENYVEGPSLYYWQTARFVNFGDYLSLKLVERIVGGNVKVCQSKDNIQKFLAIGSVIVFAKDNDVVWGSGMNYKITDPKKYKLETVDIKAVRGPKTRQFINETLNLPCPEVYGDPGLLTPYFFPEFKRPENPQYDYVIVPHYDEKQLFPKEQYPQAIYPTEYWSDFIRKILNSRFVIASSLHGLVIAEAYGIPARWLRISDGEPTFKYEDYYLGTGRENFKAAQSIEEALELGGEDPINCDLQKLYESFPFEYWPNAEFAQPNFK